MHNDTDSQDPEKRTAIIEEYRKGYIQYRFNFDEDDEGHGAEQSDASPFHFT